MSSNNCPIVLRKTVVVSDNKEVSQSNCFNILFTQAYRTPRKISANVWGSSILLQY